MKRCYMCKKIGEDVNHLFLHYHVAWKQSMLFGIFGVSWAVYDLLACWRGWIGRYGVGGIWQAAPLCLIWCLSRELNAHCFEGMESSVGKLKQYYLLRTLYEWTLSSMAFSIEGIQDSLDSLRYYQLCIFCLLFYFMLLLLQVQTSGVSWFLIFFQY